MATRSGATHAQVREAQEPDHRDSLQDSPGETRVRDVLCMGTRGMDDGLELPKMTLLFPHVPDIWEWVWAAAAYDPRLVYRVPE